MSIDQCRAGKISEVNLQRGSGKVLKSAQDVGRKKLAGLPILPR